MDIVDRRQPVRAAGGAAVGLHELVLLRNAERAPVEVAHAPVFARGGVEQDAEIGEVGERVAERRQLPVEHGGDARLGRVEHDIADPEIAVRHARLVAVGHARRQPVHQPVHFRDLARRRLAVIARPAVELALEIIAGAPETAEPDRFVIDGVQRRQHLGERAVHEAPLLRLDARHGAVRIDAALHPLHDIEGRADHALVVAKEILPRHRHRRAGQRLLHPVFPVHRMRRRQELAWRLLAKHIFGIGPAQHEGRVGLAVAELAHPEPAFRIRQPVFEPGFERRLVETVRLAHTGEPRALSRIDCHGRPLPPDAPGRPR